MRKYIPDMIKGLRIAEAAAPCVSGGSAEVIPYRIRAVR